LSAKKFQAVMTLTDAGRRKMGTFIREAMDPSRRPWTWIASLSNVAATAGASGVASGEGVALSTYGSHYIKI
jgi:hypothetical protein